MTQSALSQLLQKYREKSHSPREQGTYFENLVLAFLREDKTYAPQFSEVMTYADWAEQQKTNKTDTGIDLVARNKDDDKHTAIQCKFYDADATIDKKGLDSFIAASDSSKFSRRIFVDTTNKGITDKLSQQLAQSEKDYTRISYPDLERSSIDWEQYLNKNVVEQTRQKQIMQHQSEALDAVTNGLKTADRGKLIMACGTGKTFVALRIAEQIAGESKSVLFLVPSLSLMSQSITEWSKECKVPLRTLAVCSDTGVGKRATNKDDPGETYLHDLAYPATTNAVKLAEEAARTQDHEHRMTVVFATYQSLDVIARAQKGFGLDEFDLIICDEAHRTTGATRGDEADSNFVLVHDQAAIKGKKRVYMTATPRVYVSAVKEKAEEARARLFSMDDEEKYGKELYVLKFDKAVERNLLSDYKVIILALDEAQIAKDVQKRLSESGELSLDDATKIIGCYKALAGRFDKTEVIQPERKTEAIQPMRKAVAFCSAIKLSKIFAEEMPQLIEAYQEYLRAEGEKPADFICKTKHVDGSMDTVVRNDSLSWLKQSQQEGVCHVLSNVRCLSEGVDVPSLDAVLFIHPRKSKVEIVQAVGRVMRKAEGKKLGYVILPVAVTAGMTAEEYFRTSGTYEMVWDVLNALRSHDMRLDAEINKIDLGEKSDKIILDVGGVQGGDTPADMPFAAADAQKGIHYEFDSFQKAILAKIVEKCGTRSYWKLWAQDIADIATRQIARINAIIQNKDSEEYRVFHAFHDELRRNINDSITEEQVVEMLAQHIITSPVFNALFQNYDFSKNNPVSQAMQKVVQVLEKHHVDSESKKLAGFYESVRLRVQDVKTHAARQKIIIELYDTFFKEAFPKMAERLGIVYTPVECVDFIIHSVNHVLAREFGQSLSDTHTHIIDPFTGTGTFITRLIQSGLIRADKLEYKYKHEMHANEIVLLAYYIASINIESVYHDAISQKNQETKQRYQPFEGICLTDTFQLYEQKEDLITPQLPVNSKRLNRQKNQEIKVIIGNPPYSAGQGSGNDNNQNIQYPALDESIENSYAQHSTATNKNSLYDSYIRAIKWASDRIGETGVIGFITNAGWLDSNAADGMRKCLREQFSSIYVFHLRGDQRTSGEKSRQEGGKVFGSGSRAPIAISIFIKKPQRAPANIYFFDIGDYLTREQKLSAIQEFGSIAGIAKEKWQRIQPDAHNDWLNQRDDSFYEHIAMGAKKEPEKTRIFANYSRGLATTRDSWVYNFSKSKLQRTIQRTIDFYNKELARYNQSPEKQRQPETKKDAEKYIASFVSSDSTQISFSRSFRYDIFDNSKKRYRDAITTVVYRPFTKTNVYYDGSLIQDLSQMPSIFPEAGLDNLVIGVSGVGGKSFSVLISKHLLDLQCLSNGQCFPLKLYEPVKADNDEEQNPLLKPAQDGKQIRAASGRQYTVKDAITDSGLWHFADYYNTAIHKEDLFYYIYGLLHSPDYRNRFASNLGKDLPHIPRVKQMRDFTAFSQAGRDLAKLHLNYETQKPYPVNYRNGIDIRQLPDDAFSVTKMKFANKQDKSAIIYNNVITITDIPPQAYEYVVNGKPAIEWVMERQAVSTHKESKITNNANDWAKETMNNPRYPHDLLLRVITVSLETVKIVNNLPSLDIA